MEKTATAEISIQVGLEATLTGDDCAALENHLRAVPYTKMSLIFLPPDGGGTQLTFTFQVSKQVKFIIDRYNSAITHNEKEQRGADWRQWLECDPLKPFAAAVSEALSATWRESPEFQCYLTS